MWSRRDIEEMEARDLAVYAMKSQDSKGRVHEEPQHDARTCYQRDRDRVVHSEAFRKLEYKTQVFSIFEADYYRTRMTHTLEVAQIGRTIGRSLRLNEDLIEAIALAHDLGHPPFGHAGEQALNRIMRDAGMGGFNHNKRSFDIVTKYEKRYPQFEGLNLTHEVRVGILKHQSEYDQASDLKEYSGEGPTLEAQVVDFADSLAYLNHDVDDGMKAGCITAEDLNESVLWHRALGKCSGPFDAGDTEMLRYQVVKQLIDMQIRDLLSATDRRLSELKFETSEQARGHAQVVVGFSDQMQQERDALQGLLNKKLYHHYRVVRMTSKAQRIIADLFAAYVQEPDQLPYDIYPRSRDYCEEERYHIICNYIASMTDRFAMDEHKKFFNPYTKV